MITQDRLKELLLYDPETGAFTWKARRSPKAAPGVVAGRISKASRDAGGGYRWIGVDGKEYLAHRLAWLYVKGEWPSREIDHRNNIRADNRFDNLREADDSQNCHSRGIQANNTSGFKGVSWHKRARKWIASMQWRGEYRYLGLFTSPEAAHAAYTAEAQRLFGDFARVS